MSENMFGCPFCGSLEPYLANWRDRAEGYEVAEVRCDCGVTGPERYGDDAQLEAVAIWNTRHE